MRVVIDTNVFVSSFFGGKPKKVIDLWKSGAITLCLSGEIIDEYVHVLQRLGLQDETELTELLLLFAKNYNCLFTTKTPHIKVVKDDPQDDKFFACAVALKALYIISGDKHVLNVNNYMGINVVTPDRFLSEYKTLS